MATKGRTARYYATGTTLVGGTPKPEKAKAARKKHNKKSAEVNRRPEQKAKRTELSKRRAKDKANGAKLEGKDYDHAVGRYVDSSTNRGRKEKSRLKGSKRKKR